MSRFKLLVSIATCIIVSSEGSQCLKSHNIFRGIHLAPNIDTDNELNSSALKFAIQLAKADDGLDLILDTPYGVNTYMASKEVKGQTPVKEWYKGHRFYKYGQDTPRNIIKVGHFTQLVWANSKHIGIGAAKSKTGRLYVVCLYRRRGNIIGRFKSNVRHP